MHVPVRMYVCLRGSACVWMFVCPNPDRSCPVMLQGITVLQLCAVCVCEGVGYGENRSVCVVCVCGGRGRGDGVGVGGVAQACACACVCACWAHGACVHTSGCLVTCAAQHLPGMEVQAFRPLQAL